MSFCCHRWHNSVCVFSFRGRSPLSENIWCSRSFYSRSRKLQTELQVRMMRLSKLTSIIFISCISYNIFGDKQSCTPGSLQMRCPRVFAAQQITRERRGGGERMLALSVQTTKLHSTVKMHIQIYINLFSVLIKINSCYSLMPRRPQKILQLKEKLLIVIPWCSAWKEEVSILEISFSFNIVAATFFCDSGFWWSTKLTVLPSHSSCTAKPRRRLFVWLPDDFISHSFMNISLFCI